MFLKDRFILQNPSHPFLVLRRIGRTAKDGGCPSVILRKNGPPSLSLRVRNFGAGGSHPLGESCVAHNTVPYRVGVLHPIEQSLLPGLLACAPFVY